VKERFTAPAATPARVYSPFASVVAPAPPPLTATPDSGAPVPMSVTTPLMVPVPPVEPVGPVLPVGPAVVPPLLLLLPHAASAITAAARIQRPDTFFM